MRRRVRIHRRHLCDLCGKAILPGDRSHTGGGRLHAGSARLRASELRQSWKGQMRIEETEKTTTGYRMMEKKTTKKTRPANADLEWLRGHGFRRYPGGLWLKRVSKGCCALMRYEDRLGWNCDIDFIVELPFSNAVYAAMRAGGCGFLPAHALAYAIEGLSYLQKSVRDLNVDDVLEKLGKPKEEE